jgi:2,3-dihydroxybenzoate decarboxylase
LPFGVGIPGWLKPQRQAGAQINEDAMKKIALEEHYITDEILEYAAQARPSDSDGVVADLNFRLADFGERRLQAMDAAGIEIAVLSATVPGVQAERDTNRAIAVAQETNDTLAGHIQKHPRRYLGFAHLAMQSPQAAADELERTVRQLGFKGALINGHTLGHYLDEDQYSVFWERVQELQVPIYLHPTNPVDSPAVFAGRPELGAAVWIWTAENAAHALRLVFGGVFERYPRVTLLLGHLGETLPFLLWRFDSRRKIRLGVDELPQDRLPSTIIRRNIKVTTSGMFDPIPLTAAVAAMGAENILFAVDYPFEESKLAGDFLDRAPLSEQDRAKIAYNNAATLLRI